MFSVAGDAHAGADFGLFIFRDLLHPQELLTLKERKKTITSSSRTNTKMSPRQSVFQVQLLSAP